MRRVLSTLIAFACAACVHRFEEPRPDEPHAIVKIHVVHHAAPGPQLDEEVQWNRYSVALRPPQGVPRESLRVVRVRPERAQWTFATTYYHTVTRTELRTEYRTEQYACGTEQSGFGTYRSTHTRYCSRQVPQQRWVTVTDRVVDGACRSAVGQLPLVNAIYLLQYDYFGGDRCTVQCLRQLGADDGTFRFVPCGVGEPPAEAMVITAGAETALPASTDAPFVAPETAEGRPPAAPGSELDEPFVAPETEPSSSDAPFVAP